MTITSFQRTVRVSGCALLSGALLTPSLVWAVSPGYSGFVKQVPSVYTTPPDVNVMFTLDDSGSMQSDTIPDPGYQMWMVGTSRSLFMAHKFYYGATARYFRSASGNPLYYNPTVTYLPWPKADNNLERLPPANPTQVIIHPSNPTAGPVLDLTQMRRDKRPDSDLDSDSGPQYWPAAYYVYHGSTPLPVANPATPLNVETNFTRYEIPGTGSATFARAASRTDCSGPVGPTGCSRIEELQNFANWLQYYRSRSLMAKGGSAAAFAAQGTNLRVGFARINGDGIQRKIRPFSGTDRTGFFTALYNAPASGWTPLRAVADTVGQYFTTRDVDSPWAESPGKSIGTEYSCRRSFHFLSTDGFWNKAGASTPAATENNDAFSGKTPAKPDGTTYTYSDSGSSKADPLVGRFTINPFIDEAHPSGTLSDVAAYYWKTDLRTDLDNVLTPTTRDPAFWQHLTTFTIGLGINGSGGVTLKAGGPADLSTQAARDLLVANKTPLNWTVPNSDNAATGDDLIHASMSGRGRYFSATDPNTLATGLAAALAEVADQPMDLAAVAADAPQVRSDRYVYQATFNPNAWSGRLYAFSQAVDGTVNNKPTDSGYTNPTQVWEASHKMPAPNKRNIYTLTSAAGPGVAFVWGNLSSAQRTSLNDDPTLLDYLRGSGTQEIANGGLKRDRTRYTIGTVTGGVLGDIVNGSPVKGPSFGGGYERLPATDPARSSYETFRTDDGLKNLRDTLFVGANDGMLHAFDSTSGVERFAYVPNAVYSVPRSSSGGLTENKLALLADPAYTHRFTVDGPPNIGDAFIGKTWRSILSASNGAGARGVFTLDVTQPVVDSAGFGESSIKWEFTEAQDEDVGFVPAYPHIVRLRNGKWAALFGNGADSKAGQAKLFVIDLDTGAVIRSFAVGAPGNNGLMQPNFVLNTEREVTTVYAGDLKGNLWKFDLSDPNAGNWKTAFDGKPLFTAINAEGQAQVISVMPEITAHPEGGAMLVFGTGKLFEASDTQGPGVNVNLLTQSIYGVWDKPGTPSVPAKPISMNKDERSKVLQTQTAPTLGAATYGSSSSNAPNWKEQFGWYMDLAAGGERVNLPAQQVKDVVFLVANKPESNPCANGGMSKVFALDPVTGRAPAFVVFDVNNNGSFEPATEKGLNVKLNRSGILTQPIFQLPQQAAYTAPLLGTTPFAIFDRGQSTSTRAGGVELSRSAGGTVSVPNPCALIMSASQSDTALTSQYIQTCAPVTPKGGPARISWRQLR